MDKKITLSIPKTKTVCGYEIKKMPLGAYLKAIDSLKTAPEEILNTCFPGQDLQSIISNLSKLDEEGLKLIISGLFIKVPDIAISLVSSLTGIDRKNLLNDENIGLDGILDIIQAFIEVNRLGECPGKVKAILKIGLVSIGSKN